MGKTQTASFIAQRDGTAVGVLTMLWLAMVAVVGVRGDFPVNDDWAYARMVKAFLDTGKIAPTTWTFTPTVSNIWLGAAFSGIFGFSHETLRVATLFAGWLGMLGAFSLARVCALRSAPAFLVAAVYGFNPLHLSLSFSFMTDVAFASFSTWAVVGGALYFRGKRWGLALFVLASGLAVVSRQPAAVLPVAFIAAFALFRAKRRRATNAAGGALIVLLLLAMLMEVPSFANLAHVAVRSLDDPSLTFHLITNSSTFFTVLGLLSFPILPLLWSRKNWSWPAFALCLGTSFAVCFVLFRFDRLVPSLRPGQLLDVRGLGVVGIHASNSRGSIHPVLVSMCTVMGAASMGLGVAVVLQRLFRDAKEAPGIHVLDVFLLLAVILYIVPPCLRGIAFDRYSLPVVAPLLVLFARQAPGLEPADPRAIWSALGIFVVGVLSAISTLDYLTLLRSQHAVFTAALTSHGASPSEVQGGFAYDGYFRYDLIEPVARTKAKQRRESDSFLLDWFSFQVRNKARDYSATRYLLNDQYLVSLSPRVENFRLLEERPARSILGTSATVRLFGRVTPEASESPDLLLEKLHRPAAPLR